MLKVLICEDDDYSAAINRQYIEKIEQRNGLELEVIGHARSYNDAIKFLSKNDLNILLLDIDLQTPDEGIRISQEAKRQCPFLFTVFITAHQAYASEVFKTGYDYLLKPVDYNKLESTILEICKIIRDREKSSDKYLTVISNYSHVRIPSRQIYYIGKEGRRISIYLTTGEAVYTYSRIEDLINMLGKDFIRISKTQLVNLYEVKKYEFNSGKVDFFHSRMSVFASKYYKDQVKRHLILREEGEA